MDMKKILLNIGKALCYALAFVLSQIGALFIANAIFTLRLGLQSFGPHGTLPPYDELLQSSLAFTSQNAVALTAFGDVLALFALWLFFRVRNKRLREETACVRITKSAAYKSALCGFAFALAVGAALGALPIPEELMEEYAAASNDLTSGGVWISLFSIVLLGPVVEETFFRGLVYSRLRRALPAWAAAVLAALAFALIHGGLVWIVYAFCLGLVFCFLFERGASLLLCMVFHVVFNFCGTFQSPVLIPRSVPGALCVGLGGLALGFYMLRRIAADARGGGKEGKPT